MVVRQGSGCHCQTRKFVVVFVFAELHGLGRSTCMPTECLTVQELAKMVLTVAVALLSPCQQGGLMEEQGGGVVYEGSREREVGAEGSPVICSTELPLVTQQVLTVTTPEDEEPKVCCC